MYERQSDFNPINITQYVSVEGVEDNNTFVLESTVGDAATSKILYDTKKYIKDLLNLCML